MKQKQWWGLAGLCVGAMIAGLDISIVNSILPVIKKDLQASIIQLQWAMTCFALLFSACTVPFGLLADIKGRRKILYFGLVGFALVSLGAGLSPSPMFLIVMRALQGVCVAVFFPCSIGIIQNSFPEMIRGRVVAIFFAVFGFGVGFGPIVGSIVTQLINWRWIFFINIPLVIISVLICLFSVQESKRQGDQPVDWLGSLFFIIFIGSLVFLFNEWSDYGLTAPIITALILLFISLILLVIVESKARAPLINLPLYINRNFASAVITASVGIVFGWIFLFIIPLYLHSVLGFSEFGVGATLFAMTVMTIISPIIAGILFDKKMKKFVIHAVFFCDVVGLLLAINFGSNGPLWLILPAIMLIGIGWGIINAVATPLSIGNNFEHAGVITGALVTNFNVAFVIFFSFAMIFFHYGLKHYDFLRGLHFSLYALLAIAVIAWLLVASIIRKAEL